MITWEQGVDGLPTVNDGDGDDFGDSQQDTLLELRPGLHPDMAEEVAHFPQKGLDDIEPRPVFGRQERLKEVGASRQIGVSFIGDMRRLE